MGATLYPAELIEKGGAWPKLFLTPKRDHVETQTIYNYLYFSRATLNETFKAKYDSVLLQTS